MTVNWQPMSVPLGQGLETKASAKALPPGKLRKAINVGFGETGALKKRNGLATNLGSAGASPTALGVLKDHLVAHAHGRLMDMAKTTATFKDRGALRSVPVAATRVKSSGASIAAGDAYSLGGYRVIAWRDTSLKARVVDEATGATLLEKDFGNNSARLQTVGTLVSGVTRFYLLAGDTAWIWASDTGAWSNVITVVGAGSPGFCIDSRLCLSLDGQSLYGIFATQTALTVTHFLADLTRTQTVSTYLLNQSDGPVAIAVDDGGTFIHASYVRNAEQKFRYLVLRVSDLAVLIDDVVDDNVPTRVSIAKNGNGNAIYLYDYGSGTTAFIKYAEIAGAGGFAAGPGIWKRSVTLSSEAVEISGDAFFWVTYSSVVQSDTDSVGAVVQALNAACFLVGYSGVVVGRNLYEAALASPIASASYDGSKIVSATLSTSLADSIALTFANAGLSTLEADVSSERMRSAAAIDGLIAVGGSPNLFDGANVVEQGFHVFPEVPITYTPIDNSDSSVQGYSTDVPYSLGMVMNPALVVGGDTLGYLYLCIQAGTTGSVAPAAQFADTAEHRSFTDGGVVWFCLGLAQPLPFQGTHAYNIGDVVDAGNGTAFVCKISGTSAGSAPSWPGSGEISSGGATFRFISWNSDWKPKTTAVNYGMAAVYDWVSDAGEKNQGVPSPIKSISVTSFDGSAFSKCVYVVTNLRITAKQNVLISIYRTDENGNVLQKVAQVANDPTTDFQVIVDQLSDDDQQSGLLIYAGQDGAGALPNEPPPPCSLVAKWNGRTVVNDLDDPCLIHPSLIQGKGSGAAWSSFIELRADSRYGAVIALASMDGKLYAFHAERIGVVAGDGPDNTGAGSPFPPVQYLATDVGCINPDSVVVTQLGIFFQSAKGIFLLTRGDETQYIGAPVENPSSSTTFDTSELGGLEMPMGYGIGQTSAGSVTRTYTIGNITSAVLAPKTTEVRFTTDQGTTLIYDYFQQQWSVSTFGAVDAAVWSLGYVTLQADGTAAQELVGSKADWNASAVNIDAKLGDIRLNGVDGYGRVRAAVLRFEADAATSLVIQVCDDYGSVVAQSNAASIASGESVLELLFRQQKVSAVSIEIIEMADQTAPASLLWVGMDLVVGLKSGAARVPPSKRIG